MLEGHPGLQEERSLVAKAVAALVADPSVKQHFLLNARTGDAALWVFARTGDRADHLVGLLADYDYSFLRYYGEEGMRSAGWRPLTPSPS